jgi:hypothetical protein
VVHREKSENMDQIKPLEMQGQALPRAQIDGRIESVSFGRGSHPAKYTYLDPSTAQRTGKPSHITRVAAIQKGMFIKQR